MVRKLNTCQSLRIYGYQVVEAANAGEALLLGGAYQGPITLMLTDVVMPQMSGIELASRLSQLPPGMRVVYMSGYTDDAVLMALRARHYFACKSRLLRARLPGEVP